MSDQPDTSEAVAAVLRFGGVESPTVTAQAAIAAERKALAEQGYAVIKVGSVPEWMDWVASVSSESDKGCSHREVFFYAGHEDASSGASLYRLSPVATEGSSK